MMRVGLPSFVLQGGESGISTYLIQLIQQLQRIGSRCQFELFVPEDEEHLIPALAPHTRLHLYHPLTKNPLISILWHHSVLKRHAKRLALDLVHIPCLRRVPYVKGCKMVATVHDMAPLVVPGKYDAARTLYHKQVLTRLIHRCERILTVSHSSSADIVRLTGFPQEKIHVIPNGIDTEFYHPVSQASAWETLNPFLKTQAPFMVYVSRLEHPGKNHVTLINAFNRIRQELQEPLQLVLAGADWNGAQQIHQAVQKSPHRADIHCLGYVPREVLRSLYSACRLMIFPSLYEGFGFPVLEAFACGAPVALSQGSSLTEIGAGHAIFFDPHKPEEMAQAALTVLSGPEEADSRQKRIAHAARFTWQRAAEQTLEVYRQVVQEG